MRVALGGPERFSGLKNLVWPPGGVPSEPEACSLKGFLEGARVPAGRWLLTGDLSCRAVAGNSHSCTSGGMVFGAPGAMETKYTYL